LRLRVLFSTDHKDIGILYGLTSSFFLLFGFSLALVIRWQHAYSGQPLPLVGGLLGASAPGGVVPPELYNQLGAMHGTIMVFLGVVPLAVGAFGNYVLPLQIGTPDMAFPRLNLASYWFYAAGGVVMLVSFFMPGGATSSGWTSYPPLAVLAQDGQTWWLVGMMLVILSSLLGAVNFITTTGVIEQSRLLWNCID
jgi:cytochrome c oxidase subunit 1